MEKVVHISGVLMDPNEGGFFVLLEELEGEKALLIGIGPMEARSIWDALNGNFFFRPLTHDLIRNMLDSLKINLQKIVVTKLENNVFYANLYLQKETGELVVMDSRPSDAIAIALRTKSPIYVNEEVLHQAGVPKENVKSLLSKEEGEGRKVIN
ncbi:MAG: bifunctional nuclease family protein [Synergistetes bacterium]|nr:bifunctional nuclease family protein [Synergistota bacterium]MCX8127400.1 bifunctional nuclease family protein [Synergistota bacterium]MDW8192264.1 bifunctional nuclease family protein [Synergistota bacterium]